MLEWALDGKGTSRILNISIPRAAELRVLDEKDRKALTNLLAAEAMQKFINATKAAKAEDSGTFEKVIISSDDEDRQGEKVNQEGLDFSNFMKNPVVLWGHDYYSPPIGIATRIYRDGNKTLADGKFAPTEFGQQIRKLYELGFQRATSIGFIPKSFDEGGNTQTAEVLEFLIVRFG